MTQSYIGAPMIRGEDVRFLTGRANYLDDITRPGMLHAALLRSPHAHALIARTETAEAAAMPGCGQSSPTTTSLPWPSPYPFGCSNCRVGPLPAGAACPGQGASCWGTGRNGRCGKRYLAEDALEAIYVEYEPLPAVTGVRDALKDEVVLHGDIGTNLAGHTRIATGDVDEAFRTADYTRREEFTTNRHTGNPMETRGLLADYDADSGELTVWGPTKVPHFNRAILARHLELSEERIHFIEPDVGGGFGIRGEFYPEDFLVPFASMKLGRPVKWVEDRVEHLMSANHSREVVCEVEIGGPHRRDAVVHARHRIWRHGRLHSHPRRRGAGAHRQHPHRAVPRSRLSGGRQLRDDQQDGGGNLPRSRFLRSRFHKGTNVDLAAADLGLDPADIRRKNLIKASEMPYTVGLPASMEGSLFTTAATTTAHSTVSSGRSATNR